MIFLDTNVVSEPMRARPNQAVLDWLVKHDIELALPSIVIAEVAYGIEKIRPEDRARRLADGLAEWRRRFADRTFAFDADAAMLYGKLMGRAARHGRVRAAQDGMIAAIALLHDGSVATRNTTDFADFGVEVVDPWRA